MHISFHCFFSFFAFLFSLSLAPVARRFPLTSLLNALQWPGAWNCFAAALLIQERLALLIKYGFWIVCISASRRGATAWANNVFQYGGNGDGNSCFVSPSHRTLLFLLFCTWDRLAFLFNCFRSLSVWYHEESFALQLSLFHIYV